MTYVPGTKTDGDKYEHIVIVSRGKAPEDIVHDATCNRCKSTFKFKSTSKGVSSTMKSDGTPKQLSFLCPVCKHTVTKTPSDPYNEQYYR